MDEEDTKGLGFTIECLGGERLVVSDVEASALFNLANYFQNVFKHGTLESSDRLLRKEDWSLTTAKRVVAYLTGKQVEIPLGDQEAIPQFAVALQQILAAAMPFYPVLSFVLSGVHVDSKELGPRLLDILKSNGNNTKFAVRMRLCGIFWDVALKNFVLLLPDASEGATLSFGCRKSTQSGNQLKRIKAQMEGTRTYQALTPLPLAKAIENITTIMHIISLKMAEASHRNRYRGSIPPTNVEDEAMSIMIPLEYIPTTVKTDEGRWDNQSSNLDNFSMILSEILADFPSESPSRTNEDFVEDTVKRISAATGALGSMFQPKKSSKRSPMFYGTFLQLKHSLDLFLDELSTSVVAVVPDRGAVSLLMTAPTSDNLQSLITALLQMNDEKIEVDFYQKSYNVQKGIEAMKKLLMFASDPQASPQREISSAVPITLVEKEMGRRY